MRMTRVIASARSQADAGLSLVEVMVSLAIFSIIMIIVSTVVVNGFRTINVVNADSEIQVQQQNALIWITRLLRYSDNPVEGQSLGSGLPPWVSNGQASTDASGNSRLTFYTYAGTGTQDAVPYKAELYMDASGNLVSKVTEPTKVPGYGMCWMKADNAACSGITQRINTRVLVTARKDHVPAFRLTYINSSNATTVPPVSASAAAWSTWASAVRDVVVSITDTTKSQEVQQTVRLVNPR